MDRVSKAERELMRKMQRMTNADRIRSMTDEELVRELAVGGCPRVHFRIDKNGVFDPCPAGRLPSEKDCFECWLDYLKQEATDGS